MFTQKIIQFIIFWSWKEWNIKNVIKNDVFGSPHACSLGFFMKRFRTSGIPMNSSHLKFSNEPQIKPKNDSQDWQQVLCWIIIFSITFILREILWNKAGLVLGLRPDFNQNSTPEVK